MVRDTLRRRSAWNTTFAFGFMFALATSITGCGGPAIQPIPVTVSRYDALAPLSLTEFVNARELFERGDVNDASAAFDHLFLRLPDNILVGTWLQEAQLAASAAAETSDTKPASTPPDARSPITDLWSQRATENPTAANLVLAARVAATREEASALLDKAGVLDPKCAWVPYGLAWMAARASEWPLARDLTTRAKAADPGHVWTWWLEAWITTRTGAIADAAAELEAFVERATDDPRIDPHILSESQLDLALLWTLQGEAKQARTLIQHIDTKSVGSARRLLALASVDQALDKLAPALAAAEEAEKVAPGQVMPVLQQALLYDDWLDEPDKAGAAWKRVLEMARNSSDLSAVLERTRAGVRLERHELNRAKAAAEASSSTGSAPDPR